MSKKIDEIAGKLKDNRSKKVIFVAHCILNENTRYLGGAFKKGVMNELVNELQSEGLGIVQMKCPEQKVWGGVLKKQLIQIFDSKNKWSYRLIKIILPLFIWNTKRKYRQMAKEVVEEIKDYIASGYKVTGIIGIAESPSCGVYTDLDIQKFLNLASNTQIDELDVEKMNYIVKECSREGKGLFIKEIENGLRKNNLEIRFLEYSSEMSVKKEIFKT